MGSTWALALAPCAYGLLVLMPIFASFSSFATQDTLWMASRHTFDSYMPSTGQTTTATTILVASYNIETLEKQLVLSKNTTGDISNGWRPQAVRNPVCRVFDWIYTGVSLVTLLWTAFVLYRLDVPSCVVPTAAGLAIGLNAVTSPTWTGLILLVLASGCLCQIVAAKSSNFLWKYVTMEMEPPSSTTIPGTGGSNTKLVTQKIKVTNSMLGTKNLMLKLKVSFTLQGNKTEHMATCSGFPPGEY